MLTDYHLHLRPDDLEARAEDHFTEENVSRYRALAAERGIAELGVSEHVYRFEQALTVWQHPLWREFAIDDLDAYCEFVRTRTDLRLGIEADFVAGAEDRTANLLQERDFDYIVGSVHFLRELLADVFALYVKTKNFHWHMSGPHFRDYHLLLDEQATQIFAMTDDIAERARKLGGTTIRSISDNHAISA